jgi:hypothetical protein
MTWLRIVMAGRSSATYHSNIATRPEIEPGGCGHNGLRLSCGRDRGAPRGCSPIYAVLARRAPEPLGTRGRQLQALVMWARTRGASPLSPARPHRDRSEDWNATTRRSAPAPFRDGSRGGPALDRASFPLGPAAIRCGDLNNSDLGRRAT